MAFTSISHKSFCEQARSMLIEGVECGLPIFVAEHDHITLFCFGILDCVYPSGVLMPIICKGDLLLLEVLDGVIAERKPIASH